MTFQICARPTLHLLYQLLTKQTGALHVLSQSRSMMGKIRCEGCEASWEIRLTACTKSFSVSVSMTPPVLVLRSKRGKFELEISRRIRCPALNRFAVAHRSRCSS